MEATGKKKKIFLIAVTDKEGTLNRMFQETMLKLLSQKSKFSEDYIIEPHNRVIAHNLYDSIDEAIRGRKYEGYIIILDCLDTKKGICNPNVMFEFGAVKYFGKPFIVMAANSDEKYPFDVSDLNIESIPKVITNYIEECYKNKGKIDICEEIDNKFTNDEKDRIDDFLKSLYEKYKVSLGDKENEMKNVENEDLLDEILKLKKMLNNTAEYIEGEDAAFTALRESIEKANSSLRTTRFANQSIVGRDASTEQKDFMKSLYEVSDKLSDNFERIICNNHPAKWIDIFNILFYGKDGSKVYIRKEDFSIHFELVIIDEKIAFIHFYQKDYSKQLDDEKDRSVEKINSTLRIQGRSICKRLANIFDRLHHRDYGAIEPQDPSRTLLGIPIQDVIDKEDINNGCFVLANDVPCRIQYSDNRERKKYIIDMFKNAFKAWKFETDTSINKDKVNMVVGIALVEDSNKFINEMNHPDNRKLTDEEYGEAMKKYSELSK